MSTINNPALTIKNIKINNQSGNTVTLEFYGSDVTKDVTLQHRLLTRLDKEDPMQRCVMVGQLIGQTMQPGEHHFQEHGDAAVVEFGEAMELLRQEVKQGATTALIKSIKADEEGGFYCLEYHNPKQFGTAMPQAVLYVFDKLTASLKTATIVEVINDFGDGSSCEFAQDGHIQVAVEPGPAAKIRFAHYRETARVVGKIVQRNGGYAFEYPAYDLDDKPFKVLEDIDTSRVVVVQTVDLQADQSTYLVNGSIVCKGSDPVATYPVARNQGIGTTNLASAYAYLDLCAKEGTQPAVEVVLQNTLPQVLIEINEYPQTSSRHDGETDALELIKTYIDYKCQPYQVVSKLKNQPFLSGDFKGDVPNTSLTVLDRLKARKVSASEWIGFERAFIDNRTRYFKNVCDVANEILANTVNTQALIAMDFGRAIDLLARALAARWKSCQDPAERAKIEEVWEYARDSVAAAAFAKDIETTATGLLTKQDVESVFIDK